jgi:hypothetical protein
MQGDTPPKQGEYDRYLELQDKEDTGVLVQQDEKQELETLRQKFTPEKAKGGKFLDAKELAKRLNTTLDDYHKNIKRDMKKDFAEEMKVIGTTNPDFSPNDNGMLCLRTPRQEKRNTQAYHLIVTKETMINKVICQCTLNGRELRPEILSVPKSIEVNRLVTRGSVVDFGRHKNEISDEGLLMLDGTVDDMLSFLANSSAMILETKCDVSVTILVEYSLECNFEFTAHQLDMMSRLKIPIGITCYSL